MIERLKRRKAAYQRLFGVEPGRYASGWRGVVQRWLGLEPRDREPVGDAARVLADLKRFAKLPDAPVVRSPVTGQVDPIASAVLAGRQEAVNRVLAFVHIDDRTLFNLKDDD